MSRFLPADHSKGDERTIGGYAAVHARPAAFDGADGVSYSVEILSDRVDAPEGDVRAYGAFFLFVQWKKIGEQGVAGHLESGFLAHGADSRSAKAALGAMRVEEVERILNELIRERDDRLREEARRESERADWEDDEDRA